MERAKTADVILLSQGWEDHAHRPTLRLLPKDTSRRRAYRLRRRSRPRPRPLGFTRVTGLRANASIEVSSKSPSGESEKLTVVVAEGAAVVAVVAAEAGFFLAEARGVRARHHRSYVRSSVASAFWSGSGPRGRLRRPCGRWTSPGRARRRRAGRRRGGRRPALGTSRLVLPRQRRARADGRGRSLGDGRRVAEDHERRVAGGSGRGRDSRDERSARRVFDDNEGASDGAPMKKHPSVPPARDKRDRRAIRAPSGLRRDARARERGLAGVLGGVGRPDPRRSTDSAGACYGPRRRGDAPERRWSRGYEGHAHGNGRGGARVTNRAGWRADRPFVPHALGAARSNVLAEARVRRDRQRRTNPRTGGRTNGVGHATRVAGMRSLARPPVNT